MYMDLFLLTVVEGNGVESPKLAVNRVPLWAKAYIDLFRCQGSNFEVERQYNEQCSLKAPHCAVCALFVPRIVVSILVSPVPELKYVYI